VAQAAAAGIDHLVLATSYLAGTFEEYFGDGSGFGVRLTYVTEVEALGTGGAMRNVVGHLQPDPDAPIVVLNGDVLSGHDIAAQVAAHTATGADVTLHLVQVADARAYGCVPTDADGRVTAFLEKMPEPVTDYVNAGCYVFRRRVLDEIPAGVVVSVERETFPALLQRGALVMSYREPAPYWLDVGTPAAYVRGSCDLVLGRVASPALPAPPGEWLALDGAEIAPDALLDGGTAVGAGAVVGAGSVVHGSVLLDGARVGAGCVVRDSVVGAGAEVGPGCVLEGAVLGDRSVVGSGNELRLGARVWCDAVIAPGAIRFSSDAT
jgi:mannose-1-phosphate guanylyltransferase